MLTVIEIGPVPEDIYGTYKFFEVDNLALQHTNSTMVIINTNTTQYKHCAQDLFQFGFPFFPSFQPKGSKWMSKTIVCQIWGKNWSRPWQKKRTGASNK